MPTRSDAPEPREDAAAVALCRATLYAAVALGFQPPTPETLQRLTDPAAAAALADAARVLEAALDASGLSEGTAQLASPHIELDHLASQHRRLFGHTARGEVPAYETEYGNEALFQQPQELSDIAGFMHAFGLMVRPALHERIDHVGCECELVAFLACKEAYALQSGDTEMLAAAVRGTMLFLRDHLARFVPAFGRRLARADNGGHGLYAILGRLLGTLVAADCARLGLGLGCETLGLRPDPASCAAPMGCGTTCADGGTAAPASDA